MSRSAHLFSLFIIALSVFCMPILAQAQNAAKQVTLGSVYVNSSTELSGQQRDDSTVDIRLWGIEPLPEDSASAKLASKLALEQLIRSASVNCTIKAWQGQTYAIAQCVNTSEKDIALALIEQGYAMADRQQIAGTLFETIYNDAETKARQSNIGLWPSVNAFATNNSILTSVKAQNQTPFQLTEDLAYIIIAAMVAGPFVGMLIVAFIIYGGFRRLISLQKYQMAVAQKKDRAMREREKFIVAASLEGEINTNRAKLDAFIIIYEEMLKNLRDPSKEPKYRKGGDIIHEKPALSRNVYDSNLDKLDLLGPQIVADVTGLYTMVEPNPDYKTIEPDTPIDDVVDFVNQIIRDAEMMLDPMDRVGGALNVIVRDKRAKSSNPIG